MVLCHQVSHVTYIVNKRKEKVFYKFVVMIAEWWVSEQKEFDIALLLSLKQTGRGKGYAFVQFESDEIAKIVADSMSGYLMFRKKMICEFCSFFLVFLGLHPFFSIEFSLSFHVVVRPILPRRQFWGLGLWHPNPIFKPGPITPPVFKPDWYRCGQVRQHEITRKVHFQERNKY